MAKNCEWETPSLVEISRGTPDDTMAVLMTCKYEQVAQAPESDSMRGGCNKNLPTGCTTHCETIVID